MAVPAVVALIGLVKTAYDAYKAVEEANDTYKAVMAAYKTYQEASGFLQGLNPTPENATLLGIASLHRRLDELRDDVALVRDAVRQLLNHAEQVELLSLQRQLDLILGDSRFAVTELEKWVEGGHAAASPYLENALRSSTQAAEKLRAAISFFQRPNSAGAAPIFDHRVAIVAYMSVIVTRLSVLAVVNPDFRHSAATRSELSRHADWLDWIIDQANAALIPEVSGRLDE